MRRTLLGALIAGVAVAAAALVAVASHGASTAQALPLPHPTISDYQQVGSSVTPPTQAQCASVGRRCFAPAAIQNSYNLTPLYAAGNQGQNMTIAIVDSWGSDTIRHDLNVYDTQFGLPHMCGEDNYSCAPGDPKFDIWNPNGSPSTTSNNNGKDPDLQNKAAWALEVSLDVELAHATAPRANIILVAANSAETLGVQGFPNMMKAEKSLIENHQVQVISQSFASAEEAFSSTQSLLNLRDAFVAAAANGVTVLGSTGDSGSANGTKQPVSKGGNLIPFPTVEWPASDPLVTGVGGTYLCTNAVTGLGVDSASPPVNCQSNPGVREIGWIDSGGGFSHVFSKPAYQNALPAGSTPIGASRGVPDIAAMASARTGALVYITLPPDGNSGIICPGGIPCSTGWYVVGGTSLSTPVWAGMVAIADQIAGHGLGLINPKLYSLASGANYGMYFYDVTTGNNGAFAPDVPGYPATTGWDPVTGLGTPNAATLLPALAS